MGRIEEGDIYRMDLLLSGEGKCLGEGCLLIIEKNKMFNLQKDNKPAEKSYFCNLIVIVVSC